MKISRDEGRIPRPEKLRKSPLFLTVLFILLAAITLTENMAPSAHATSYHSINPNGDLAEWAADEHMGTDSTKDLYLTWNDENLYFGWDGTDWGSEGNLFFYFNTSSDGSFTSIDWDGTHSLPFKADHALSVRDSGYYDLRVFTGGAWSVVKDNTNFNTPTPYIGWSDEPVTEIALSRAEIGGPSGVDIVVFAQWEDAHNVWASFPTENPASGGGSEIFTHFYHIPTLTPGIPPDTVEIGERTGGVEPREDALNLAIVWHQHQPYYKNVLTGKYEMPWVRVHGSQEYIDSPKILMEHPGVTVTFNIVPSLMEQMEDYARNGVLDRNTDWLAKGIDNLTELEKHELQFEFFWVPSWQYNMPNAASRYYHYLHNKTMHNLTPETIMMDTLLPPHEMLDLAVLYHLFQISPWYAEGHYLESERDDRILGLYDKYGGFTLADLDFVLGKQTGLMGDILSIYAEARDAGQAEIITSPYSHPIMPLLMMPGWYNEGGRFVYKEAWYDDTVAHLDMAKDIYRSYFGENPVGMWPSEQSVSEAVISPIADSGIKWMISDEMVLEASGYDTGDNNVLMKPYIVEDGGKNLNIVFRDRVISDRIAWQYGKMDASVAVDDFMDYMRDVRDSLNDPGDSLVTVAVDGENWMFMSFEERDNGRPFLDALYERLENTDWIRTVGVGEHMAAHPPNPATHTIDVLARDCPDGAGSWIDGTMSTWSGEEEESLAWERLIAARDLVMERQTSNPSDPALEAAWKSIYAAEGSDWFWWYGLDQDSGYDELWDELFKIHLMNVYTSLGEEFPPYLKNLWLPPEEPVEKAGDVIDPGIDGFSIPGEWDGSYLFNDTDEEPVDAPWDIENINVGYSSRNLYVRLELAENDLRYLWGNDGAEIALYIGAPNARDMNIFSTNYVTKYGKAPLNFPAKWRVKLLPDEVLTTGRTKYAVYEADGKENWVYKMDKTGDAAALNDVIELAIPFKTLGIAAGDEFRMRAVTVDTASGKDTDVAPGLPMSVKVPRDISPEVVLYTLADTPGDETGDGDYSYPLANDFAPHHGLWDVVSTTISATEYDLIFRIEFAELTNVWHMRQGFCHEIIQIYIDQDRVSGSGNLEMLPGANAEVTPEFAWEVALSATGDSAFVEKATGERSSTGCEASGSEENNVVEIVASKSLVGNDVVSYGYVTVVGSQDGFGTGKWRDVDAEPGVWTLGGGAAPNAVDGKDYDPGILDAVLSPDDEPDQAVILGEYDVSNKKYARVPGIEIPEIAQQIFGVKTKGITAAGAIITWQSTKPGTTLVEYGTAPTLGSATSEDVALDTAHTVILEGLIPSTTYYFRTGSRDGASGDLFYSEMFSFNTTASVDHEPPMIILPGVDIVNETVAEVHWLTDELARGFLQYGEEVGNLTDGGWSGDFMKSHIIRLEGLTPGETYRYRISVKDSSGNINETDLLTFRMVPEDPDDGGSGETIMEQTDDALFLAPGLYHSLELADVAKGDVLVVEGEVAAGVVDILLMTSIEFQKYLSSIASGETYFQYYPGGSRLGSTGQYEIVFSLPSSGTFNLVFDNTMAPIAGAKSHSEKNATLSYDVEVLRNTGLEANTTLNTAYGAFPSSVISNVLTIERNTYVFFEMKDYRKGWQVYLDIATEGGGVDLLVLEKMDYEKYRIESSASARVFRYLKEASHLNVREADHGFVIPLDGTYYLVIDNTPVPEGGARGDSDVKVTIDIAVDRSNTPLEVDHPSMSEKEEVRLSPDLAGADYTIRILVIAVVVVGILVAAIAYVLGQVRKEKKRMEKLERHGNPENGKSAKEDSANGHVSSHREGGDGA